MPSSDFNKLPQIVANVTDVEDVLRFVDGCILCCGQSDEALVNYILNYKGKIMDLSSKFDLVKFNRLLLMFNYVFYVYFLAEQNV